MALTQIKLTPTLEADKAASVYHVHALAAAESDAPALGSLMTALSPAITPTDADLTSFRLVGRSVAEHPRRGDKREVALVYRALKTQTLPTGFPENWRCLRQGSFTTSPRRGDGARYVFEIPAGLTRQEIKDAVPLAAPDESGLFQPVLDHWHQRVNLRPGTDELTVVYAPPTWGRILEDNPGRGVVQVEETTAEYRPILDLDGNVVWHEYHTDQRSLRWRPVKGPGLKVEGRCILRLDVVTTRVFMEVVLSLLGTVNGRQSVQWGNRPKGTLLLRGARAERAMTVEALTRFSVLAEYRPEGWNSDEVQRYEYRVYQHQVYDHNDSAVSGEKRTVGDWKEYGDPYTVRLFEPNNWVELDAMIEW